MSELTIGDRVKIVRQDSTNKGQAGTVYDILPGRPFPYHVWVDGWSENMGGNAYTREELEQERTDFHTRMREMGIPFQEGDNG